MAASCDGYVAIVRILIEAKAQFNAQREVCYFYMYTTRKHTAQLTIVVLGELTMCYIHRMAGLLFTWQLTKAELMW